MASDEFDQTHHAVPPKDITVVLRNSLVAGNQSTSGFALVGPLTSQGYNLLQNVNPGTLGSTDQVLPANADLSRSIDPMLRKNPGPDGKPAPTETLALLPGSPASDAIPVTACMVTDPSTNQPIITDQRGVMRPDDNESACDIGAYESAG